MSQSDITSYGVELREAETDALTIAWPPVKGAYCYTLEYRRASAKQAYQHVYHTLSEKLKVTEIRKKNLRDEDGDGFYFKVGVILGQGEGAHEYITHMEPFKLKRATKIVCIGNESDALTVTWPKVPKAVCYVLEYRKATRHEWETLSESLKNTQVRKKNLEDLTQQGFMFRVRAVTEDRNEQALVVREKDKKDIKPREEWISHDKPFRLQPAQLEMYRLDPPTVETVGHKVALISWEEPEPQQLPKEIREGSGGVRYQVQMRLNVGGVAWKTIAPTVRGCQVKKKNLKSKQGYMFRYRVAGKLTPFSLESEVIVPRMSKSSNDDEDPSETNYDFSEHVSEHFFDDTEGDMTDVVIREVSS